MSSENATIRVGVIGGGISGLGVAFHLLKTAKRIGRQISVVVYDKNSGAGGTWSRDSVYEGLMTNNSWKQMLFDDDEGSGREIFINNPLLGAGPGGHRATGEGMILVMGRVKRQVEELGARIHFQTKGEQVTRGEKGGWVVRSTNESTGGSTTTNFDKIVIATGAFSQPAIPAFALPFILPARTAIPEEDQRSPLVIHTSHLSGPTVRASLVSGKRKIVVVGASKSALDASERFSTLGQEVSLVLRNPPYLAPTAIPTPSGPADAIAMVGTRKKAVGVPYPADVVSGNSASGVLHTKLINQSIAGFAKCGQWADPMLSLMSPKVGLMWSESSIFPGPEKFAGLVREGRVKLRKGAVAAMTRVTVDGVEGFDLTLRNDGVDEHIFATTIIFGSGWSTGEYPFFEPEQLDALGLPVSYVDSLPTREKEYINLDRLNLKSILGGLRTMRLMPSEWSLPGFSARFNVGNVVKRAPYRLYRLMVPLDSLYDRDIAFAGIPTCKANHVLFICQAHWITDYFLDLLPRLPSREIAQKEISSQVVWAQRLFGPSHGRLGQWLGAMWIEYCSRLCWDMGVENDGKGWDGIIASSTYCMICMLSVWLEMPNVCNAFDS